MSSVINILFLRPGDHLIGVGDLEGHRLFDDDMPIVVEDIQDMPGVISRPGQDILTTSLSSFSSMSL